MLNWSLRGLIANVMTAENVMTRDQPSCELMTDASNNGWGAVCGPQSTGGLWASDEKPHHINYLELTVSSFSGP